MGKKKKKVDVQEESAQPQDEMMERDEPRPESKASPPQKGEMAPDEGQASQEEELVEISSQKMEDLRASLDESEEKAQEYLEGWQRSRAEFANYKKRIMKEREKMYERAKGDVIKNYLDISDDLGRALQDRPESGEGAAWAEGIELIYKKLQLNLQKEGVEAMDAEGAMFDPNRHEAVFKEEHDEYESGQVIEVLQQGYVLGDRILRPALVRVAA